jgi:site-specific DNA-methyltransferase (adenine-specific)
MMKPYYEQDGITIYHGDALHLLPELSIEVAAVLTDVPYASGARTEAQKNSSGAMLRGIRWAAKPIENDQMTTVGFSWLIRELCYAVRPLLIDGGSFVTFIDWRQWPNLIGAIETTNFRVNQMIVWDKISYGLGNGFRSQHELIVHASKGTPRIVDRDVGNVLRCRREENDWHPSPKPVLLLQKVLPVIASEGDLVLDPFMGAGATLVAAKFMKMRAVGIEIEERYCEIAAKRLAQGVLFGAGGAA